MSVRVHTRSVSSRRSSALVASWAALVLCATTACSPDAANDDPGAATEASDVEVNQEARDMLPADIRDSGKLVVAVTPTYPPFEYLDDDGTTVIGQNAEVMAQAAQRLGLEVEWQKVAQFASVLTGIQAGRFAAGVIFTDTLEREGIVDILSFYEDGVAVVGATDGPQGLDVICGKTVAIATGSLASVIKDDINQEACTDAGKPPFKAAETANSDLQFTSLDSGRVEYILTSYGVGESLAKQTDDKYGPVADPIFPAPTGIAINKDRAGLSEALEAVLSDMADDGSLADTFDKWTTSDVITEPGVNVVGS